MKKHTFIVSIIAAGLLAGCTTPSSSVGLVDVQRIVANWSTYQGYQSQLNTEERALASKRENVAKKRREAMALQAKYAGITDDLTKQVRDAAIKIANDKHLQLVVTRQGVGYGGTDITPEIEKALNITEKATPTP